MATGNATATGTWRLYQPDGSLSAEGQAPVAALQAMHSQLRSGLTLDLATATTALQSGKVPVICRTRPIYWLQPAKPVGRGRLARRPRGQQETALKLS
ncbi:hypothetical protein [Mobiluncus mulieris]|uniref:hypothetical protein n=1 Tax=Mobiluncus mulieris TaxID=2052 RepID=UPI0020937CB2|nr:hypothetical protein [Mobiluncus mulieris]